jgi:hypothetical protein
VWLRASNKAGLPVPWPYVRRLIARNWGCKPFEVDEAPHGEVELELQLMTIEGRCAPRE